MHPRNRQRLQIAAAMLLCASLAGGLARAEAPRLESVDFQGGILTVQAGQPLEKPEVEMWPTLVDGRQAEIVILKFPGGTVDLENVNRQVAALMAAHPELKRLMVTSEQDGAQVTLETLVSSDNPPLPALSRTNAFQWQVNLAGGQSAPGTSTTEASPSSTASAGPADNVSRETAGAGKRSFLKLPALRGGARRKDSEAQADNASELQQMAVQLQEVIRERDSLETRVSQLQREVESLKGADKPGDRPGTPAAPPVNETLREYDPTLDQPYLKESITIANLRGALMKLATRLKATESALQEERRKTMLLSSRSVGLEPAPDAVKAETGVKGPVSPAGVPITARRPASASQARASEKPLGKMHYNAPVKPKALPVWPEELSKTREINLRAALHESPGNVENALQLADLYVGRADLPHAEAVLTRLVAQNPAAREGYYYLALVYLGQHRKMEAQAALDTYERLNPADAVRIMEARKAIRTSPEKSVSNR